MEDARYVEINCCADSPHLDREYYNYCNLSRGGIKESYGNVFEEMVLNCPLPLLKNIRGE